MLEFLILKKLPLNHKYVHIVCLYISVERDICIYNLLLFVLAKVWLHSFFQPCFTGDKAQGVSLLYASASKGNY